MSFIEKEHRGCKVWRDVRTNRTRNPVSGAIVATHTPLKSLYVAGPGIRMRSGFRSLDKAIADIDFQLDFPSPGLMRKVEPA